MARPAPLIVVVGETASGKSALALELAERFNGELICADSWTVYRGFDIGTAKPGAADRARALHHLLDVADPRDGFSAVLFQKLARQAIADIAARGKLPIMVGGTGLYIDSILYDYGFLPPSDPDLRAELNALSLEQVLERVREHGLDTTGIDLRNKRRVIRLIENNGVRPTKHQLRENTLVLGVSVERDELRERVERRVDTMLAQGLEHEVYQLAAQYGWDVEPMKGIGYSEWRDYLADKADSNNSAMPTEREVVRARIIKDTMDLAKRQRTWFKRNNGIQWLSDRSKAVDIVTTFLNKTNS
ncbi:MAG TPA: tRNA (adenosine(37)-N6)-dimethylallyltransferase MiaA [Candidatus Saccharimonadales bacterium]|nr:tRNA (adenosine(37)-N6)-dimethylallyltransferase MiaA [Candidatus Saccharimonadales bacterium]